MRRAGIDSRYLQILKQSLKNYILYKFLFSSLPEFFPPNKRTEENFKLVFEEKGLAEVLRYQKAQANSGNKKDLSNQLLEDISDNKPVKEIIASVKEAAVKYRLQEHEIINAVHKIY